MTFQVYLCTFGLLWMFRKGQLRFQRNGDYRRSSKSVCMPFWVTLWKKWLQEKQSWRGKHLERGKSVVSGEALICFSNILLWDKIKITLSLLCTTNLSGFLMVVTLYGEVYGNFNFYPKKWQYKTYPYSRKKLKILGIGRMVILWGVNGNKGSFFSRIWICILLVLAATESWSYLKAVQWILWNEIMVFISFHRDKFLYHKKYHNWHWHLCWLFKQNNQSLKESELSSRSQEQFLQMKIGACWHRGEGKACTSANLEVKRGMSF